MTTKDLLIEIVAANNFNPHVRTNQKLKLHLAQDAYSARENLHFDPAMNQEIVSDSYDDLVIYLTHQVAANAFSEGNNPEFDLERTNKNNLN